MGCICFQGQKPSCVNAKENGKCTCKGARIMPGSLQELILATVIFNMHCTVVFMVRARLAAFSLGLDSKRLDSSCFCSKGVVHELFASARRSLTKLVCFRTLRFDDACQMPSMCVDKPVPWAIF